MCTSRRHAGAWLWLVGLLVPAACGGDEPAAGSTPTPALDGGGSPRTPPQTGSDAGGPTEDGASGPVSRADSAEDAAPTLLVGDDAGPIDAPASPASPDGSAEAGAGDGGMVGAPLGPFPLDRVRNARVENVVSVNTHVEGPSWRNGELFFASDGNGLMRVGTDRRLHRYHPRLIPVGSYYLADGSLLVCDKEHVVVQIATDGKVQVLPNTYQGQRIGFCNDLTVDRAGNVYFTDARGDQIFRIGVDGEVTRIASGINYPNGIEVDPESKFIYFTLQGMVMRMSLDGTTVGRPTPVTSITGDGLAFDAWGNLWIALPGGGGGIRVYNPERRQLVASLDAGGGMITNLTFGGPNRDVLYATVSNRGIIRLDVGVKGFLHPGAPSYKILRTLDLVPVAD